jgi:polyhydroxyalkanoate synthesis regulator phasin
VKRGDTVQAGIVISNSEVGQGSLRVEALDYWLSCTNGMITGEVVRKAHLGRRNGHDAIDDAQEFFRDETRQANDRAFFLSLQDTVGGMFDQRRFNLRLNKYRAASGMAIVNEVPEVVEIVAKRFSLTQDESKSVLSHLIKGGDLSQYGLANAITRAAQDVESYDRSTDMEAIGGDVIALPPSQWHTLAGVAA